MSADAAAAAARELAFRALKTHLAHGSVDHEHWGTRLHTIDSYHNVKKAAEFALKTKTRNSAAENKQLIARAKAYTNYAARVQKRMLRVSRSHDDTPLTVAIKNGNLNAVRDMLSNRGHVLGHARHYPYPARQNVHERTHLSGSTALHVAMASSGRRGREASDAKITNLLLQKGANVDARDSSGSTALHHAVVIGAGVLALLKAGANVNARDSMGRTPLHNVALLSNMYCMEVASILIEYGADLHAIDDRGKTPLDYARSMLDHKREYAATNMLRNLPGLLEKAEAAGRR